MFDDLTDEKTNRVTELNETAELQTEATEADENHEIINDITPELPQAEENENIINETISIVETEESQPTEQLITLPEVKYSTEITDELDDPQTQNNELDESLAINAIEMTESNSEGEPLLQVENVKILVDAQEKFESEKLKNIVELIEIEEKAPQNLKAILSLPTDSELESIQEIDANKLRKYAKKYRQILADMPDCAEKSILLLLLNYKNEELKSTFEEKQSEALGKFLSQEQVTIISDLMSNQLKNEALLDAFVKSALSRISKFQKKEEVDINSLKDELSDLLKYLRPVKLDLMLELIDEALKAADKIRGKDVIQLLGETGTGKSTTIHFLAGSTLEEVEVDGIPHIAPVKVINPDIESFITSPHQCSETRIINAITIDLATLDPNKAGEITLCDSPGFGDTAGPEVDIANGIGVVRALKGCRSVKPVVLVSNSSIGDRSQGLVQLATILNKLMRDLPGALSSFSYVFTKFYEPKERNGIVGKLTSKKNKLNREQKKEVGPFFDDAIKKAKTDIFFLDPIKDAGHRFKLIDAINACPPIEEPDQKFQDFATPDSMGKLKEQLYKHKTSIERALANVDIPLVVFKINQLAKVKETIALHESNTYYDICIKGIKQLIEDFQSKIELRLTICLDPGNTNVKSDIIDCSKRMRDLFYLESVRASFLTDLPNLQDYVAIHITQLQNNLYKNIKASIIDVEDPKKIVALSTLTDLNKMQLIDTVFAQTFAQIPEHAGFVSELSEIYEAACEELKNQFIQYANLAEQHLSSNDFSAFVSSMDILVQMKSYYSEHLKDVSMQETCSQLMLSMDTKWSELVATVRKLMSIEQPLLESEDIETIKILFEIVDVAYKTPGMFAFCTKTQFEEVIAELKETVLNFFIFSQEQLMKVGVKEGEIDTFEAAFQVLTILDQLRENTQIELATQGTYQKSIKQIKSTIGKLKDIALHSLELLNNSQPGSPLSINYESITSAISGLKQAKIFSEHPENMYEGEFDAVTIQFSNFVELAEKTLSAHAVSLKEIDIFVKLMMLIRKVKGLSTAEHFVYEAGTPLADLCSNFEVNVNTILDEIETFFEKDIPNVEQMVQVFAFFKLTSSILSDEVNQRNEQLQLKIKEYLTTWLSDLNEKLYAIYDEVLLKNEGDLNKKVEQAQYFTHSLLFLKEIMQAYTQLLSLTKESQIFSLNHDPINEVLEQEETSFEQDVFQTLPEKTLRDWLEDPENSESYASLPENSNLYFHLNSLVEEAKNIKDGEVNNSTLDRIKIANQLRPLDEYLSWGLSYTQTVSDLEMALREQHLTLTSELKVLTSTGKYSEFKSCYQRALASGQDMTLPTQEVTQILSKNMIETLGQITEELKSLVLSESTLESFQVLVEKAASLHLIDSITGELNIKTEINLTDDISEINNSLKERFDEYTQALHEQAHQGKLIKVENNLQGLNKLLNKWAENKTDEIIISYRTTIEHLILDTCAQLRTGIDEKIEVYRSLPFVDYIKEPPFSFIKALEDLQEINPAYARNFETAKQVIVSNIDALFENFKHNKATSEDEQKIKQLSEAIPYIPQELIKPYLDALKDIEAQVVVRVQQLKQELQDSTATGDLKILVDTQLSKAVQLQDYTKAQLIIEVIQEAITTGIHQFQQEIAQGNFVTAITTLPKSFENWHYYQDALHQLKKSAKEQFSHIFSSNYIDNLINKMLAEVLNQYHQVISRIDTVKTDKLESNSFKVIDAHFDKLEAMLSLIEAYNQHNVKFYQVLLDKKPDLSKEVMGALTQVANVIAHNYKAFRTSLDTDNFSDIFEPLNAAKENADLIERIISFAATKEVKNLVPDFSDALKDILPYSTMNKHLAERLLKLKQQVMVVFLHNPELHTLDKNKCDDFYATLSKNFSSLNNARMLVSHSDPKILDVQTCMMESETHIALELKKLEEELLTLIKRMPFEETAKYTEFNIWLNSLKSFRDKFLDPSLSAKSKSVIDLIERSFDDRLTELSDLCVNEKDAEALSKHLISLKYLGSFVPCYLNKIKKGIDATLSTISKRDGAQKIATLGLILRQVEGDDQDAANRLINDHTAFEGYAITIRNQKTLRYTSDQVLADLRGDYIDTSKLKVAIKRHEEVYWELVENGLLKIEEAKKSIVTHAKKVASGSSDPIEKIIELSAHLFAYWTLDKSTSYSNMVDAVESSEGMNDENTKDYLLQPHAAQVISIFRLLGLDVSGAQSLQSHIVQIGTGEGKSVTLAITASILALLGYDVDCVCYSEYLSQRDHAAFLNIFTHFGLADRIHYGTFNKLSEQCINQFGDVRELVSSYIQGHKIINSVQKLTSTPKILLIDEVDVFFSKDFYGNSYRPLVQVQDKTISDLVNFIWEHRYDKKTLIFENIKSNSCYSACVVRFRGWEFLIESAVREMLADVQGIDEHEYVLHRGRIGYKDQDGISFDLSCGYKTVFAYFKEQEAGRVTKESRDTKIAFTFDCGIFSYAEIPNQYQCIMGVSGTLENLSEFEKQTLAAYAIKKATYIPSVYGSNQLAFAGDSINDVKIESAGGYFSAIGNEIKKRLAGKSVKRAVLVFFENSALLREFRASSVLNDLGLHDKVVVIDEQLSDDEKEGYVAQAVAPGTITLLTRAFGRGTDFKCYDERLNDSDGVHVIQTFVSDSLSEETQIKGRTARQGNKGSYSMVLRDEELERFGITRVILADIRASGKLYGPINQRRCEFFDKTFDESLRHLEDIRQDHVAAQVFVKDALLPGKIDDIKKFLLERNKHSVLKKQAGIAASCRTICLMDATGSMENLIVKAKQTVATMFERACAILQEKGIRAEFELQFVVYRNYNCDKDSILQYSNWESDPHHLQQFLNSIHVQGGMGNEAIEVGFWHVDQVADSSQVDQVILIGDMPPNEKDEVLEKRKINFCGFGGESYWSSTPFAKPTYYKDELDKLVERKIPVHAFYVKEDARESFQYISEKTGGESESLDINSSAGADRLTDLITKRILNQVGGLELVKLYEAKYGHLGRKNPSRNRSEEDSYNAIHSQSIFSDKSPNNPNVKSGANLEYVYKGPQ